MAALLLVLLLVATTVAIVRWSSRSRARSISTTTSPGVAAPSPVPHDGLPVMARKPSPVSPGFEGCPAEGDGGDPLLNRLKNRIDSTAWIPVALDDVLHLSWPVGAVRRRFRRDWSPRDAAAVARYEGIPISVEGYITGASQSGPESTNCHGAERRRRDWHVWVSAAPGRDHRRSIVVEPTPATRAAHPAWTLTALRRLARDSTRVRISGWLMLDSEHPEQVGKTRGTIWEIHPVMRIEARRGNRWSDISAAR